MRSLRIIVLAAFGSVVLAGCGGGSKVLIPVDSPILPWEAPEPAEGDPAAPADAPPAAAPAAEAPPTK